MGWAASDETRPREALCRWEHDNGLAILNMSARAFDCDGRFIGTLKPYDRVSVSPDGRRIAWISCESTNDACLGKETSVRTMSEGSEESAVSIGYIEGLKRVNRVSLSSTGVAAMVVSRGRGDRGVLMVSNGELASDLTHVLRDFWPDEIEILRLSGDGSLMVSGSRELFVVIDITNCSAVLRRAGRFPSLSPNGARLAYRDVVIAWRA